MELRSSNSRYLATLAEALGADDNSGRTTQSYSSCGTLPDHRSGNKYQLSAHGFAQRWPIWNEKSLSFSRLSDFIDLS